MVISMDVAEFEHVSNLIRKDSDGERLFLLLSTIYRTKTGARKKLANKSGLKEWAVRDLLPVLAKKVTLGIGLFKPDENIRLEICTATAWKMAFRLEFETANEIIESVFSDALEIERFEILLDLFKLAETTELPFSDAGVTKDEIIARHQNLLQFIGLRNLASKLKSCSGSEREILLSDLESLSILNSIDNALSKSATAHYYWIWSRVHFFRKRLLQAIEAQNTLLASLKENTWLERDYNFFLVREQRVLVGLLLFTNQIAEVNQLWMRIGNIDTSSPLIEALKWQQIYPNKIAAAMEVGDIETGRNAVSNVMELISSNSEIFPKKFIVENLYFSSYFFISIGKWKEANRLINRSLKMQKPGKTNSLIWPMIRFFEILIAYKLEDSSEVLRLSRNFRNTKEFKTDSYFPMAARIIGRLAKNEHKVDAFSSINRGITEIQDWTANHFGCVHNEYFDLLAWLQSEKDGCTMLDIFRNRASMFYQDDQSSAV